MTAEITVANHQTNVEIPDIWLTSLTTWGGLAIELIKSKWLKEGPLAALDFIDVALVDDLTSASVHQEFMDIPGATDVITFDHGEIVIGASVALRHAADYQEPLLRELLRYLVHGLLHLAGHDDTNPEMRELMENAQEKVVEEIWNRAS